MIGNRRHEMGTEQDIKDQRDDDIQILDEKIGEAITIKNGLALNDPQRTEISNSINHLMDSRTELHIQELRAGLESAQLAAALAMIASASRDLKTEAAKMKNASEYISNANAVIGATTKV